ncbi:MAG: glycosyltransferase [Saprospiraceae bacterium]|nr:glycosyltransferase [Saprospiraceae bacterium]
MDANFLSEGKKMGIKDKIAVWIRGNFFIPDARSLWINPSAKYLLKYLNLNPVDALISSGPPHSCHLIAEQIKKSTGTPWIVDYRDPWTQIDYFDDLRLTGFAKRKHLSLEKRILNACDLIITVGKTMAKDLAKFTKQRTEVITNGFDEADRLTDTIQLDTAFTITYIGIMNDSRNPEVLWEAMNRLKMEDHPLINDIRINLVGKPESVIAESVRKYKLDELVHFIGYVPHAEAIKYQNTAQILLLMINKTTNNKSILTGKIFEYLASGRPVLCIGPKDGDASDIIMKANAGIVLDYDDVEGLVDYLKDCYKKYLSGNLHANTSGIKIFSRYELTGKLAKLLNEITQKKEIIK